MKQNYEAGRSMVEMLGTLAIIGVLSIGGIAGYSYGMDKYRANTIMNDVNLRAIDLIAQANRGGTPNLSEWPTITAGKYTIGLENGTIGIQVSDLPESICQMVFDGMINNATVKIGTTEYDSATDDDVCGDTNTMVFYVDEGGISRGSTQEGEGIETKTEIETTPEECKDVLPNDDFIEYNISVDGVNETWLVSNASMTYCEAYSGCLKYGGMISGYDIIENWSELSGSFSVNKRGQALYEAIGTGDVAFIIREKKGDEIMMLWSGGYVSAASLRNSNSSYRAICYK